MDDLTAQEQELILTLRYLKSFSVIVHRNEHWRIILADHDAGRTQVGAVSAQTTHNRTIMHARSLFAVEAAK